MIAYINDPDNGLQKTEQTGKVKVVLTYKPWQLMAGKQPGAKNKTVNKRPAYFDNKLFFVLSLSANNKELLRQLPFNQYSKMVQVLAFKIAEFVDITPDEGKPVQPLECIFQQTYGMGIANNLLIVFNKSALLDANNLTVQLKEFGLNLGNLTFTLETKNIKKIQNIAIN